MSEPGGVCVLPYVHNNDIYVHALYVDQEDGNDACMCNNKKPSAKKRQRSSIEWLTLKTTPTGDSQTTEEIDDGNIAELKFQTYSIYRPSVPPACVKFNYKVLFNSIKYLFMTAVILSSYYAILWLSSSISLLLINVRLN